SSSRATCGAGAARSRSPTDDLLPTTAACTLRRSKEKSPLRRNMGRLGWRVGEGPYHAENRISAMGFAILDDWKTRQMGSLCGDGQDQERKRGLIDRTHVV